RFGCSSPSIQRREDTRNLILSVVSYFLLSFFGLHDEKVSHGKLGRPRYRYLIPLRPRHCVLVQVERLPKLSLGHIQSLPQPPKFPSFHAIQNVYATRFHVKPST